MKLKGAKQVHYDSGPNMTPLVDVVMVILIFLMLAGSFGGTAHFLVSNAPIKQSGGAGAPPPPSGFIPDEPQEVRVDPTRDGFVVNFGDLRSAGEPHSLTAAMSQRLQQLEAAGHKRDKIQIVISPGGRVKYQHLAVVYDSALRAGCTKVGFATPR